MARAVPIGDYESQVPVQEGLRRIVPEVRAGQGGQALEQLGAAAIQTQRNIDVKDAAVYVSKESANSRIAAEQVFQDRRNRSPDELAKDGGFTPSVVKGFRDTTAEALKQAPNAIARQMMQEHLNQIGANLEIRAQEQDAQDRHVQKIATLTEAARTAATAAELDPNSWRQIAEDQHGAQANAGLDPEENVRLSTLSHELIQQAAGRGLATQNPVSALQRLKDPKDSLFSSMPLETREAISQHANDSAGKPVYDSLTNGDFKGAQSNLNSVKSVMDPHKVYELQNIIDAKIKEKQNEQKQDIADRFQDSMTAAQYGLKNPVTVSRAELAVLYPKDAQRHWDALQGVVAAGAKAQEYDRMTPEQIQADVNASRPTEGGPEAALRIKSFEIRANAADQSLKARNQDPAQFAIDSGAGWKPIDLAKPDDAMAQLKARANSQGLVSEQTGVNTPLLSKQETKQVTSWLDNQKPTDRLQTLTALRSSMPNDQSYGALMKQIAPGSPITAVAGAMLDKPPALAPAWYDGRFAVDPVIPQRMLEGEQILRAKDEKGITSKFPMPKDTDLMPQFMAAIGGSDSNLFRGRPETLETAVASFKALYAAEASHSGKTNGVIDSTMALNAARSVIGAPVTYGSTNLVAPAGMDPTRFEGAVDAASKSSLMAAGYSNKDIEALRGYGLRELGDTLGTGRYVIIDGNGDPLKSKNPMVGVQLTKLEPKQETAYQDWLQKIGMTREKGMNMTPDGTGVDYDMRGYFAKYGATPHADGQHFTDEFKLPNHPTFSDQSNFAKGDNAKFAGHWNGDTFVPPAMKATPRQSVVIDLNQLRALPVASNDVQRGSGRASDIGDRR